MEAIAKAKRGFAAMDAQTRRAIARKGGQSVPPEKRVFAKDRSLATSAGQKGGRSVDPANRSFSQDRELASDAGRKGGRKRAAAHS
ncbi:general stress protein [Blastochloris viridis]|uniref:General stress protein n=1 Tax=Blastochloris viridis TaxID=1079 RepID=A0A0H5B9B6_BLAVI|nr:KGG domain-containing protein [Blastochloris viridis]ALK07941.1 Stress-induced bacterial acidophilic repeat motif protein [Blastochloris viridis]BAR98805.1 General stress protein [Blastochloris viridis]CUU43863.1 Stress-induced bacterial acidophilic repeat motif [Blastochloris viridis]